MTSTLRPALRRLLAAALLVPLAAAVVPAPLFAGDKPVEPPVATVIPANDAEKKSVLEAVAKATGEKSAEQMIAALVQMQTRRADEFLPAIREGVASADPKVQAAAIVAAGAHDAKDLEKTIRKILRAKLKGKQGDAAEEAGVPAACIDYVDRLGVVGEQEHVFKEILQPAATEDRKVKAAWSKEAVRAALRYLGRSKWKPCVPWLIDEMVARPEPRDPNDPKNPPSDYWEARCKVWFESEGWTRWALKEITGQEYRSVQEWRAWLKLQDKKAFK